MPAAVFVPPVRGMAQMRTASKDSCCSCCSCWCYSPQPGPGSYDINRFYDTSSTRRRSSSLPGRGYHGPELSTRASSPAWVFSSTARQSTGENIRTPGPGTYLRPTEWWPDGAENRSSRRRSPSPGLGRRTSTPAWSFGSERRGAPGSWQVYRANEGYRDYYRDFLASPGMNRSRRGFGSSGRFPAEKSDTPGPGSYLRLQQWWDDATADAMYTGEDMDGNWPRGRRPSSPHRLAVARHTKSPAWGFGTAQRGPPGSRQASCDGCRCSQQSNQLCAHNARKRGFSGSGSGRGYREFAPPFYDW
mmetsp:Transcript_44156/g.79429  ORF Transcript_44156/g.79429 Transcript_44156/m.79429 type:complete len:303 (+) Transcript_44156:23-931(+)